LKMAENLISEFEAWMVQASNCWATCRESLLQLEQAIRTALHTAFESLLGLAKATLQTPATSFGSNQRVRTALEDTKSSFETLLTLSGIALATIGKDTEEVAAYDAQLCRLEEQLESLTGVLGDERRLALEARDDQDLQAKDAEESLKDAKTRLEAQRKKIRKASFSLSCSRALTLSYLV
jgi:hypothetical protein